MSLDPTLTLKRLLAHAFTEAYARETPRSEVIRELQNAIDAESLGSILPEHIANLEAIVKARTLGERCGDHISQAQLALLKDAIAK